MFIFIPPLIIIIIIVRDAPIPHFPKQVEYNYLLFNTHQY